MASQASGNRGEGVQVCNRWLRRKEMELIEKSTSKPEFLMSKDLQ